MDVLLGEQTTEWVGYVAMWPGHRALRYYLTRATMGNGDLGERCLHGTRICTFAVNNIICFYGSESQFVIHDDPGAGL